MKCLFMFSVGPVQSFLAQARKTHDLYAGSKLLSALCLFAMREFNKYGGKVIFPEEPAMSLNEANENNSLPNRFVGIFEIAPDGNTGEKIKKAVQVHFKEMADNEILIKHGKASFNEYEQQIGNHLEIFWLMFPYSKYTWEVYRDAEQFFTGSKNMRSFIQLNEGNRKCALDGERDALFYRKRLGANPRPFFLHANAREISSVILKPGEALSAVSFLKRNYLKTPDNEFDSTAEIAMMQTIESIDKVEVAKEEYQQYKRYFKKQDWDAQLLDEDNLTEGYFIKNGLEDYLIKPGIHKLRDEHHTLISKCRPYFFPKYYAVLVFDGDQMGKWLSGGFLKKDASLFDFQDLLSKSLKEFADNVPLKLKKPVARTIYASGEDFIGFVNLHHLLDVLKYMREKFDDIVATQIDAYRDTENNSDRISFSAGIVIAHYREPLGEVIRMAREMEDLAKKKRDSFSMCVMKHSGGTDNCRFEFKTKDRWVTSQMQQIIQMLNNSDFSDTFIRNIVKEIDIIGYIEKREMMEVEVKRLISRSCQVKRNEGESKSSYDIRRDGMKETLFKAVMDLYIMHDEINDYNDKREESEKLGHVCKNFTGALQVCNFIHRNTQTL